MNYLSFNKEKLVNLEYSLSREILGTNRAGSYISTTMVCCNTRKYHGLLVCPVEKFNDENFVLLSSLDETIIQYDHSFNLGIHRYPELYEPNGHKYIRDFKINPTPSIIYRVGGVILKKEFLMVYEVDQLLIRYTLLEANSPTKLQLRPFLAFRNRHQLSKANLFINTHYSIVNNGIATQLYDNFPVLHMQLSKKNNFISNADWYYNIEYMEEKERGYDYLEDLYTLGYFEVSLEKEESIVFSASLKEEKSNELKGFFEKAINLRAPKDNFLDCLKNTASQFIIQRNNETEIVAGYPWFGRWGRDTFISLPGLTLSLNFKPELCKNVLDTMSKEVHQGLFPNIGKQGHAAYNSVDAPMWFFWSIQQYDKATKNSKSIWKNYGAIMKDILNAFKNGINSIKMHDNGLIWAKEEGKALTWMDAVVNGKPVTQRGGYAVEINALWYNAINYVLKLAKENNDLEFLENWKDLPEIIKKNFHDVFWIQDSKYLADYVDENGKNIDLRSNQIIATSLEYSPLNDIEKSDILYMVKKELLTSKGLRSLSPNHPNYKGIYKGNQEERDHAYHQGTVWVWQLSHYVEASFNLLGKKFLKEAKQIVNNFEEDMTNSGVCSINEIYDGNPPHHPRGCISQAWSVSEVLRIIKLIEDYKKN